MWILKSLWNYVIIGIKYIADITKTWNDRGNEFLQTYMNAEDEDEELKIFWNAMEHYGMEDYIS